MRGKQKPILRKIFFLVVVLLASLFGQSIVVEAGVGIIDSAEKAGITITCPVGVPNCEEVEGVAADYSILGTQNFILKLVGGLLNFAAIIAVMMLVVVALRLVTAHGNQDSLASAKKQIIWTIAGLFVIILSLLIVRNITEKAYEVAFVELAEAQECAADLIIDGLLGPLTDAARGETPNRAGSFIEPLATNCLHPGESVAAMPLRQAGDPSCLAVSQFQSAYNSANCDPDSGLRDDS